MWRVRGGLSALLSVGLASAGTLAFAVLIFQLGFACPACLNPPNAHLVSWAMFALILLSPLAYLVVSLERHSRRSHSVSVQPLKSQTITFATVMTLILCLTILRFIIEPTPQGSDTPNYLYVTNLILEGSPSAIVGDGRELTFLLLAGLRMLVEDIFAQPFQLSMMIFPALLSNLMALAAFHFVRGLSRDNELAVASMAFSGFSFFLIRMSYDLYAQMFGLSILLFLFGSLTRPLSTDVSRKTIAKIAGLSVLLALSHTYTWILGLVILTLYLLTGYLERIELRLTAFLAVLLPGVVYLGIVRLTLGLALGPLPGQWYERTLATPSIIQGVLFPFQTRSFSPLSFTFFSDPIVGFENPLILVAAAYGALALMRPDFEHSLPRWLFSWTGSLVLLMLLGFSQQYRLILLVPVGIFAGYAAIRLARSDRGMVIILRKFSAFSRIPGKTAGPGFILLLVILLVFPFSAPRAFAPQYVYYPNGEGMDQLLQARDLFGFGNPGILILVQDPGLLQNNFQWARAITGANVYQGSVVELIAGKPFLLGGVIPIRPDLRSLYVIVIPPALYPIGNVETRIFLYERGLYLATPESLLSLVSSEGSSA